MRKILMLIAAMVGILCFSTAVLAEGFTLDGGLLWSQPNNDADEDLGYLNLGGEMDLGQFFVGGSLLVSVYKDPPLEDWQEAMTYFYGIYGGYKIVDSDNLQFAGLAGYYFYKQNLEDEVGIPAMTIPPFKIDWAASSLMVGFKAAYNADPFSVSFIYMYGVSNESTVESTLLLPGEVEFDDPSISWFQLKGSYALSDTWSLTLAYQRFSVDSFAPVSFTAEDAGSTGFTFGVTKKF